MPAERVRESRVGFVGAGRMATALATGLCRQLLRPEQIVASDSSESARRAFTESTTARAVDANLTVFAESDIVFLAVKPHQVADVIAEVADHVRPDHLVISIAAGISLAQLERDLGGACRVVRVMPNTPCLIGHGAAAFALGDAASASDAQLVSDLLSTVGIAIPVPEQQMDAVTGLSGSGPAFVYQVIEALSDGGVRMGLPRPTATQLAAQTVMGAARMVLETGEHPGTLKDAVASPGGTTIAGLHALERGGLRAALMDAVESATVRASELD